MATPKKQTKAEKAEALAKASQLEEAAKAIRKVAGPADSAKERQAVAKKNKRLEEKTVHIPQLSAEDREWRDLLEMEGHEEEWLWFFFSKDSGTAEPFSQAFTPQRKKMISEIGNVIKYGYDKAIAAARGDGKTTYCVRTILMHLLKGTINFAVICASTGPLASSILETIRNEIETNALLFRYYPEVCVPVRSLNYVAQNARTQVVSGFRHDNGEAFEKHCTAFHWTGNEVEFPNVPGSPSTGAIVFTRGLDAAVRGLNRKGRRPQVVVIDDPDTEETANNPDLGRKLKKVIDLSLGGLGSPTKPVGRIVLTTIRTRECVSAWYTDPKVEPTWMGERFRSMLSKPAREDLWEEFMQLYREDKTIVGDDGEYLDPDCRRSHNWYLERLEIMNADSGMANPFRFKSSLCRDGSQAEVSAIESYYIAIAKNGRLYAQCELDNDPPEETGVIEHGITIHLVQRKVSGYRRFIVPPGATILAQGMDCRKTALHYVVRAYRPDGVAMYEIDYGVHQTFGTEYGSSDGADVALKRAILERMEEANSTLYETPDGQPVPLQATLIDAGWMDTVVYDACREAGKGVYPIMGVGISKTGEILSFPKVLEKSDDKRPGKDPNYYLARRDNGMWLVECFSAFWKRWEHERWMTDATKPGSLFMWGESSGEKTMSGDEKGHYARAQQTCNETEIEEPFKGGFRRRFKAIGANHWLDASVYCNVGAIMLGMRVITAAPPKVKPQPVSMASMKAAARNSHSLGQAMSRGRR